MKKIIILIYSILFVFSYGSLQAQTYNFTTAGATGTGGPTQAMVNTAYTGTTLDGAVIETGVGTQEWTVPVTAVYTITAAGARGGNTAAPAPTGPCSGGNGRSITITETLNAGDLIRILVGQVGGEACNASCTGRAGGGGGGTFIYNVTTGNLILAAGGGGGAASRSNDNLCLDGVDAPTYTQTNGSSGYDPPGNSNFTPNTPGTGGNGGTLSQCCGGTGGAGFNAGAAGNGVQSTYGGFPPLSFLNGGNGSANRSWSGGFGGIDIPGGFGGGAGAGVHQNWEANGGGGGGYSGGGGSPRFWGPGGGGGNFLAPTATFVSEALNGADGFATIAVAVTPEIANNDADGDGTPDIADPCSCTDPLNPDPATVMGPGGGQIFHELVTVTSGAGETWEMDATTTGALDATGAPLVLPAAMTEISPGVYTISFYHEIGVGFNGDFSNGTATLSIANSCNTPCNDVPTLGEWGLIVFTLLLLNLSILFVMRKRRREAMDLAM